MSDRDALRKEFAEFDAFWTAYPRRVAKIAASRAFTKAIKKTSLPVMLAALKWQQTTQQWQKGIIPNASTWLHQERWADEPHRDMVRPIHGIPPHARLTSKEEAQLAANRKIKTLITEGMDRNEAIRKVGIEMGWCK